MSDTTCSFRNLERKPLKGCNRDFSDKQSNIVWKAFLLLLYIKGNTDCVTIATMSPKSKEEVVNAPLFSKSQENIQPTQMTILAGCALAYKTEVTLPGWGFCSKAGCLLLCQLAPPPTACRTGSSPRKKGLAQVKKINNINLLSKIL